MSVEPQGGNAGKESDFRIVRIPPRHDFFLLLSEAEFQKHTNPYNASEICALVNMSPEKKLQHTVSPAQVFLLELMKFNWNAAHLRLGIS